MRIISLWENIPHANFEFVKEPGVSLYDCDLLIVSLPGFYENFPTNNLDSQVFEKLKNNISTFADEINYALKIGKTVIIYPAFLQDLKINHNGSLTPIPNPIAKFEPFKPISFLKKSGENYFSCGSNKFNYSFIDCFKYFRYEAEIEKFKGSAILKIKDTEKVVGVYRQVGKGHLFFLPRLISKTARLTSPNTVYKEYYSALDYLVKNLPKIASKETLQLPKWGDSLRTPNQVVIHKKIVELTKKESVIQKEILLAQKKLSEEDVLKGLFCFDGDALELATKNAFLKMGAKTSSGLVGKHDLVFEYEGQKGVVEVKGVGKSASLSHVRQLLQWVMENADENADEEPKGILVLNSFKNLPLDERTETSFPDNVKKFARKNELTLITGLQLFCLVNAVSRNTITAREAFEKLLKTKGTFAGFSDWESYLTNKN